MKKIFCLAGFLLLCVPALAQHQPPAGMPGVPVKPLPERGDVVSWKTLAQVELVRQKDRFVPQFSANVAALDKKEVKIQGFMLPLEMGDQQKHFVLSAVPSTCSFCVPAGPEGLVEIRTKKPVKYTFEPVVISGRLAVLKDDPTGIFYRIADAVQAN
jgi:hypothetical protein